MHAYFHFTLAKETFEIQSFFDYCVSMNDLPSHSGLFKAFSST